MHICIIFILVVVILCLLVVIKQEKKASKWLGKELYAANRQHYYRLQRQKVIEYYCLNYFNENTDLASTLKNMEAELKLNSGGYNDWQEDYKRIERILLATQSKKVSI